MYELKEELNLNVDSNDLELIKSISTSELHNIDLPEELSVDCLTRRKK